MIVTTADSDEVVGEYSTKYMTARPTKDGRKIILYNVKQSLASTHVFPHFMIRSTVNSYIPSSGLNCFVNIAQTRAIKKRVLLSLLCSVNDICIIVHEYLGGDVYYSNTDYTFESFIVGPVKSYFKRLCTFCLEYTVEGDYVVGRWRCKNC